MRGNPMGGASCGFTKQNEGFRPELSILPSIFVVVVCLGARGLHGAQPEVAMCVAARRRSFVGA